MIYLLDTNVCIRYLNGRSVKVRDRLRSTAFLQVGLCSIVKAELYAGALKSNSPERTLARQQRFVSKFVSLPFDDQTALAYGELRATLEAAGTLIGPYDLQIAAVALAHNLILITNNTREFSRVPNLKVEDWEL